MCSRISFTMVVQITLWVNEIKMYYTYIQSKKKKITLRSCTHSVHERIRWYLATPVAYSWYVTRAVAQPTQRISPSYRLLLLLLLLFSDDASSNKARREPPSRDYRLASFIAIESPSWRISYLHIYICIYVENLLVRLLLLFFYIAEKKKKKRVTHYH